MSGDISPARWTTLALVLLCGATVAWAAHAVFSFAIRAQVAGLTQVTAVVVEPARTGPALGSWQTPDGDTRHGPIPAPPHRQVGQTHGIWTDKAGQITSPPRTPGDAIRLAVLTGAAAGFGALALTDQIRRRLRHDAAIDAAWRRLEPEWRRHL